MKNEITQLLLGHTINELGINNTNKNVIKLLNLIYHLKHKDTIERIINYFKSIKYEYNIKEIINILVVFNSGNDKELLHILSKKDLTPQQVIDTIIVLYNT